ncbi:hypothetical protein ELQ90_15715 [Labedella phragmitis]|uniref:Uncharacterized protein n=1 Tax=Labedella phragmitis TaxID=2498849 RepID=A0A444PP38_9MICO|nr:hypothetical protein [Labedella phragmitis]RWZ46217.1 hypothetical protein ELQ90_15715 [Labedella phragmitis]
MTVERRGSLSRSIVLALSTLLLVPGCALVPIAPGGPGGPTAPPSSSSTVELEEELERLPGVDAVESFDGLVVVSVTATADDGDVLLIGAAAHALATALAGDAIVDLVRAGAGYDADLDTMTEDPWRVTVHPTEDVERVLTGVLRVEGLPGVRSTVVSGGWASVRIDPAVDFGDTFGEIAATYPFSDGASYSQGSGEHLMIVHVPERTTVEAIQTIAGIAAEYPTAEFILQSPTEGPMWPQLLVAHLDAEQGAALDARLREPDLADADPEGFAQQFQLTVVGPDGPTYIAGTLGDVPR